MKRIHKIEEQTLGPDYILLTLSYKNKLCVLNDKGIVYKNEINDNRHNKTILYKQMIKYNKVYISITDSEIKLYYAFKYENEPYLYISELNPRNIRKIKNRKELNDFINEIKTNPNKIIISGDVNIKSEEEILIDLKNELFDYGMKLREHIIDEPYLISSNKLIDTILNNIDEINLSQIKNNYLMTKESILIADYENYAYSVNLIDINYESNDKYIINIREYSDAPTYEITELLNSREFTKDFKRRLKI